MSSIKHRNPPIVEVISEFKFDESLSIEQFEKVIKSISNKFPAQETRNIIQIGVNVNQESINTTEQVINKRILLYSEDRKTLVQLEKDLLTINRLAPYEEWEKFFPNIQFALKIYANISPAKNIFQLGLRYINHIEFDGNKEASDYFNLYPKIDNNNRDITSFIIGIQDQYDSEGSIIAQLQTAIPKVPTKKAVTLDLNCRLNQNTLVPIENINKALKWMEIAHENIINKFNNITKKELSKYWN